MPTSRETLCYEQSEHIHLLWPQIAYNELPCWPQLLCLPTRAAPEPILCWAHMVSLILQQQMKVTTSIKINNSLFPLDAAISCLLRWKVLFYCKYQDLFTWFPERNLHFGWGWIYPYPGGKYQGWDLRDFPTLEAFCWYQQKSNEFLQRSQESACEIQFLLVIENLHTHCLGLTAPILQKIKRKIFTIKRCYRGSHREGSQRENFVITL